MNLNINSPNYGMDESPKTPYLDQSVTTNDGKSYHLVIKNLPSSTNLTTNDLVTIVGEILKMDPNHSPEQDFTITKASNPVGHERLIHFIPVKNEEEDKDKVSFTLEPDDDFVHISKAEVENSPSAIKKIASGVMNFGKSFLQSASQKLTAPSSRENYAAMMKSAEENSLARIYGIKNLPEDPIERAKALEVGKEKYEMEEKEKSQYFSFFNEHVGEAGKLFSMMKYDPNLNEQERESLLNSMNGSWNSVKNSLGILDEKQAKIPDEKAYLSGVKQQFNRTISHITDRRERTYKELLAKLNPDEFMKELQRALPEQQDLSHLSIDNKITLLQEQLEQKNKPFEKVDLEVLIDDLDRQKWEAIGTRVNFKLEWRGIQVRTNSYLYDLNKLNEQELREEIVREVPGLTEEQKQRIPTLGNQEIITIIQEKLDQLILQKKQSWDIDEEIKIIDLVTLINKLKE